MDNGTLALVIAPLVGLITGLITALVMRKNSQDTNDVSRMNALYDGFEKRITSLETEVKMLRDDAQSKDTKIAHLDRVNGALGRYVRKLLKFIAENTQLEAPAPDEPIT